MGSKRAMEERIGSRKRYYRDHLSASPGRKDSATTKSLLMEEEEELLTTAQKTKMVPEGIEGLVQERGSVETVIIQLLGGIQTGLAHSGSVDIRNFQLQATPWWQSSVGTIEGKPHDIFDIQE